MNAGRHIFGVLAAAALVTTSGCTRQKKPEGPTGNARSLVYSPASQLAERRSEQPTGDAAAPAAQDDVRPPAGRRVRLHLRRDAMGVAGQAPYPMSGNNLAADRASLTGTLERVGREWMVLRGDRSTYWIPRDAVLAVEFLEQ